MWPDMVYFCSASSEIRGRKKKERKKKEEEEEEESLVNYKSAEYYVGRPILSSKVGMAFRPCI